MIACRVLPRRAGARTQRSRRFSTTSDWRSRPWAATAKPRTRFGLHLDCGPMMRRLTRIWVRRCARSIKKTRRSSTFGGHSRLTRTSPPRSPTWASSCSICGQAGEALPNCRRAAFLQPGLPEAHNNLGNALHALGQVAEARQSYGEAIRLSPQMAQACVNLGRSFTRGRRVGRGPALAEAGNRDRAAFAGFPGSTGGGSRRARAVSMKRSAAMRGCSRSTRIWRRRTMRSGGCCRNRAGWKRRRAISERRFRCERTSRSPM